MDQPENFTCGWVLGDPWSDLLDSAGVAAVPGSAFGDDGAFRISVAASDAAVVAGAKGIRAAVEQLLG
ncbi:MAG: hypothetical protein EBZ48_04410 [Proteobacteria bacterium]|nr:hypothetical protein [Pseudomonadota bacterium]